jgi:thiol-disulfide isomerase/thioredoxin
MKIVNVMVLSLIILYVGQCVKDPVAIKPEDHPFDSTVVVLDNNNFNDKISVKGRIAMVDFYSPACPSCIAMIPIVDSLAKMFHGTEAALIAKFDVDVFEHDSLREAFEVLGWPTFIFFKDGKEYERHTGKTSLEVLAEYIQAGIDGRVEEKKDTVEIESDSNVVVLDSKNFNDSVSLEGRTAMVEFYSPTCGTCIDMIPIVDSLSITFKGTALVAKVDVTENDSLKKVFEVDLSPTFIFFKSGAEYARHRGRTSYDTLAKHIQSGIDGKVEK